MKHAKAEEGIEGDIMSDSSHVCCLLCWFLCRRTDSFSHPTGLCLVAATSKIEQI